LDGVSVVLHLAARPGVRPSLEDPASYCETNVTGTVRVLEAARRAGIARIVFGSSSSVYGDTTPPPFAEDAAAVWPISPYAASKRAGELMAEAFAHLYGMRIACLRFFTVYGPRQRPDLAIHRFTSLIAMRKPMDVSPEHLVAQAHERFQLQDYYGAIHLLEEVVATGRSFADAHHLLGLSYSLVAQPEQALAHLDRALTLNPHYVEALVHRAIVLNELG